jgi:hypothetical protein
MMKKIATFFRYWFAEGPGEQQIHLGIGSVYQACFGVCSAGPHKTNPSR